MSSLQKVCVALLPKRWAEALEAESRSWMLRCSCGFARSLWELGGVRWKAAGEPRWFKSCPQCRQRSWHKLSRQHAEAKPATPVKSGPP